MALIDLCAPIEPEFLKWIETAKSLTPYATEFRYPGDAVEPEKDEAFRALRDAKAILEFIALQFPPEARSVSPGS